MRVQTIDEALAERPDVVGDAALFDDAQRGERGGHGRGVAVVGRREMHAGGAAHDVAPSDDGRDGPAVAQSLADGGEVGLQSEAGLDGPRRRAERGLDLVEDEDRAVAMRDVLNGLEDLARRRQHHLGRQDDGRDLAGVGVEEGLERARGVAVELEDLRVEAGRDRRVERQTPVVPAVVPGTRDPAAAGGASRDAQRGGRRFASGFQQHGHVGCGEALDQGLGEEHVLGAIHREQRALARAPRAPPHRPPDRRSRAGTRRTPSGSRCTRCRRRR